jgi:hypothetical protein
MFRSVPKVADFQTIGLLIECASQRYNWTYLSLHLLDGETFIE